MDIPIERLLRELTPQVLGAVVRRFGDFAAAEDAVQESLLAAAMEWPREGLPDNPRSWLTQVASRRMVDQIRSESARRRRENETALEAARTAAARSARATPFRASSRSDQAWGSRSARALVPACLFR